MARLRPSDSVAFGGLSVLRFVCQVMKDWHFWQSHHAIL